MIFSPNQMEEVKTRFDHSPDTTAATIPSLVKTVTEFEGQFAFKAGRKC
jgi:hypothetical protein